LIFFHRLLNYFAKIQLLPGKVKNASPFCVWRPQWAKFEKIAGIFENGMSEIICTFAGEF